METVLHVVTHLEKLPLKLRDPISHPRRERIVTQLERTVLGHLAQNPNRGELIQVRDQRFIIHLGAEAGYLIADLLSGNGFARSFLGYKCL